jgi:hypothetical protein
MRMKLKIIHRGERVYLETDDGSTSIEVLGSDAAEKKQRAETMREQLDHD